MHVLIALPRRLLGPGRDLGEAGHRAVLPQGLVGAGNLGPHVEAVDGHPHRGLLHQCLQNPLANPPHGIGDKLVAFGLIEALGRGNQPHVASTDQLSQRKPAMLLYHGD